MKAHRKHIRSFCLLLFAGMLMGCNKVISEPKPIHHVAKYRSGSQCYFEMKFSGAYRTVSCECPDSVRVGDQVVIQFVRP